MSQRGILYDVEVIGKQILIDALDVLKACREKDDDGKIFIFGVNTFNKLINNWRITILKDKPYWKTFLKEIDRLK